MAVIYHNGGYPIEVPPEDESDWWFVVGGQ